MFIDKIISRNQAHADLWPRAPGLKKQVHSYVASYLANSYHYQPPLPIYTTCVWSNTIAAGYLHPCTNETHPPAHLQDLIPTLAGVY